MRNVAWFIVTVLLVSFLFWWGNLMIADAARNEPRDVAQQLRLESPPLRPPPLEKDGIKWAPREDGVALPPPIATFERIDSTEDYVLTITGGQSPPLAIIHPDGTVILGGSPNRAARAFWDAVGRLTPICKNVTHDTQP
jgi:hypothetical protein